MKRTISFLILIAAAAFGCGTATAGDTRVLGVEGEAFIANNDGIYRAKPGMDCAAGDMIMTRPGSSLDLMIGGMAGCRLLPDTTTAIANTRGSGMKLLVAEGNVVLNIKKLPADSTFTVDTPTSVAAVRGTQFWGRVTGGDANVVTTFAVREGSVRVTSKENDSSVELNAGQAVDMGAGSGALSARSATPGEMDAMKMADEIAARM